MASSEASRNLLSAAWQAIKDYFSGLKFFFNRQTWSHTLVFAITLLLFVGLHVMQPDLQRILLEPVSALTANISFLIGIFYLIGCGVFTGFLILALLALVRPGQSLLYKSRLRHLVSPITIILFVGLFVIVLPYLLQILEPIVLRILLFRNGIYPTIFLACWVIMILLQVMILAYTIFKALRWIWGQLRVPEVDGTAMKHRLVTIILIVLIPIAIFVWIPVVRGVMLGNLTRPNTGPYLQFVPFWVVWILLLVPMDFAIVLLISSPFVIITALVLLWRGDPKIALATAGFGVLFPALVYYYFFRVFQFFIRWEQIQTGFTPVPFPASWVFELGLFILAFLMVLQGAAKTQRKVSPNPFPLFALMVGTLVFSFSWIFSEVAGPLEILVHVELLNMSASAFSAILAVTVFIIIPVIYASLRLTQSTTTAIEEPQIEMTEDHELESG